MYKLKLKNTTYTIPKQNLRLLAMVKAQDLNKNVKLENDKDAINFLESIGIEVQDGDQIRNQNLCGYR